MQSGFNSLINQITIDLRNAEELMKKGDLDKAFKLSEKIAENLQKIETSYLREPNLESLQNNLAKFRRTLNNQMVKVVKSGLNQALPKSSLN